MYFFTACFYHVQKIRNHKKNLKKMQTILEQALSPIPYMDIPNISNLIMQYTSSTQISQLYKESCEVHDVFDETYGYQEELLNWIATPLSDKKSVNNEVMVHFMWSVAGYAGHLVNLEYTQEVLKAIGSTLKFELMAHCGVVYRSLKAINYAGSVYSAYNISREFDLEDAYILADQALRMQWIFILLRDDVAFEYLCDHPANYLEREELEVEILGQSEWHQQRE